MKSCLTVEASLLPEIGKVIGTSLKLKKILSARSINDRKNGRILDPNIVYES